MKMSLMGNGAISLVLGLVTERLASCMKQSRYALGRRS